MKELKGGSLEGYNDLALAMQRNREKRGGLISYLEQKYANAEEEDEELEAKPKKQSKRTKAPPKGQSTSKAKRMKKS